LVNILGTLNLFYPNPKTTWSAKITLDVAGEEIRELPNGIYVRRFIEDYVRVQNTPSMTNSIALKNSGCRTPFLFQINSNALLIYTDLCLRLPNGLHL
jgi:hypothetical protein